MKKAINWMSIPNSSGLQSDAGYKVGKYLTFSMYVAGILIRRKIIICKFYFHCRAADLKMRQFGVKQELSTMDFSPIKSLFPIMKPLFVVATEIPSIQFWVIEEMTYFGNTVAGIFLSHDFENIF